MFLAWQVQRLLLSAVRLECNWKFLRFFAFLSFFRGVLQFMDLLYHTMDYIGSNDRCYLFFLYSTFGFENCTFLMWK